MLLADASGPISDIAIVAFVEEKMEQVALSVEFAVGFVEAGVDVFVQR